MASESGVMMKTVDSRQVHCDEHDLDYVSTVTVIHDREVFSPCPECARGNIAKIQQKAIAENARELAEHESSHSHKQKVARFNRVGIPPRYRDRRFENYKAAGKAQLAAKSHAMAYLKLLLDGDCSASLVMTGLPGTGKTHLACAIANAYMRKGGEVVFITVAAMIRKIRETYRPDSELTEQQAINAFRDLDLLILDEVGIQKGDDKEINLLFEVINERYAYLKPTMLLSNLTVEDMEQLLGARVIDRLKEGGGGVIEFVWSSYRSGGNVESLKSVGGA